MIYIDTSAFLRGVLDQDLSGRAVEVRDDALSNGGRLVSSSLLELETRRAQVRVRGDWAEFAEALTLIDICDVDDDDFRLAFGIDVPVKSLDALHLASCMKVGADALLTADKNMRDVAEYLGIQVYWAG